MKNWHQEILFKDFLKIPFLRCYREELLRDVAYILTYDGAVEALEKLTDQMGIDEIAVGLQSALDRKLNEEANPDDGNRVELARDSEEEFEHFINLYSNIAQRHLREAIYFKSAFKDIVKTALQIRL